MHVDLLLVRHAESEDDRLGIVDGWSDCSLTERGTRQAVLVADRIAREFRIDVLYSGESKRALETALKIGQELGLEPKPDPGLASYNINLRRGITRSEAAIEYPDIWDKPMAVEECLPGGESYASFHARINGTINRILARHPEESVCIVTHAWAINAFLRAIFGLKAEDRDELSTAVGKTSLHEIRFREACTFKRGKTRIMRLNDIHHLDGS